MPESLARTRNALHRTVVRPAIRPTRAPSVVARYGGGPQRPGSRPGDRQDGRYRGRAPQPSTSRPNNVPLLDLSKAAEWWRNIFKGAKTGPIAPIKLANGHAARPGLGTVGKDVQLITNHLLLDVKGFRTVAQYEVAISKLPAVKDDYPSNGTDSGSSPTRGAGSGAKGGAGAKRPAATRGVKVVGPEAHAVLSYLLDRDLAGEDSKARDTWVYDGGAALYTMLLDRLPLSAAADAGGGAAGGSGGGGGVVRQPDGSSLVNVPKEAGGEIAGCKYKVELRRTALLDPRECIKQAQELRRQRMTGTATAGAATAVSAEAGSGAEEGVEEGAEAPTRGIPAGAPGVTSEQAALAVLELVSRAEAAWDRDSVRVGSGTFVSYKSEDRYNTISGSLPLKLLNGFRTAVTLVATGPTLTIDAASAVVAEDGPLLPQIQRALGDSGIDDLTKKMKDGRNARMLQDALEGLEVKNACNGITSKLSGKLGKSACELTFKDNTTGRTVSVEQYFKTKYGCTLQHPHLPCVLLRKKDGALPLELLTVRRSQKRMSKLQDRQKAEYIRAAAKRPEDRLRALREALRGPLQDLSGAVARAFGLNAAARDLLQVTGRVLPGPLLEARSPGQGGGTAGGLAPGNAGEWQLPGVAQPGEWRSGAVLAYLDPSSDKAALDKFLSELSASLQRQGIRHLPPDPLVVWASPPRPNQDPEREAESWLHQAARRSEAKYGERPQLVLVVLPAGRVGGETYKAIKRAGDGMLGIPTQCVDPFKASLAKGGPPPSYCNLLSLGINAKLGGVTTRLAGRPADWLPSLQGRRLMVLGADLSRGAAATLAGMGSSGGGAEAEAEVDPAAGLEYAAVVGSVDSHCVRYLQRVSVQSAGSHDVILGMRDSVQALLREFAAAADRGPAHRQAPRAQQSPDRALPAASLPEVLLMYRDGVADSMFDAVLAREFSAIEEACAAVGGQDYRPDITFVVVQKRHNTRLFPASRDAAHAKSGNVLPGTVVDTDVVDGAAFDFFLNSHAGIQGTNRAPRYTVLVDRWGFTADDLQLFTFALCHTYSTCNRSLSLPPAARLADRAADRARVALKDKVSRPATTSSSSSRGKGGGGGAAAAAASGMWYEILDGPLEASHVV